MVVRFLPSPDQTPQPVQEDRENLAEVIQFRSKLVPPSDSDNLPAAPSEVWAIEPRTEALDSEVVEPEAPIVTAAVRLLARKAISSGELRRALLGLGYAEIETEQAVAECEAALYLDDADLARTVTQKLRQSKGESRSRIRQKLRERALPDDAIETALAELDDDEEYELLQQTAADRARRMVGLDRATAERRLMGFLARRGWSGERASRAVRDALDGRTPGRPERSGATVRFQ